MQEVGPIRLGSPEGDVALLEIGVLQRRHPAEGGIENGVQPEPVEQAVAVEGVPQIVRMVGDVESGRLKPSAPHHEHRKDSENDSQQEPGEKTACTPAYRLDVGLLLGHERRDALQQLAVGWR
jgi:hypothetical protein